MKPFFSIVVATYNRAQFLPVTIGSIQAQDFTDFELLIVDDGSKDNTREVIDVLMQTDKRIKYIYQDNAERGAARNKGFRAADGQYVVFFDSDDRMPLDYLTNMNALTRKAPGYNFYSSKFLFEENGNLKNAPVAKLTEGVYGLNMVLKGNPIGTLFCVRKEFLFYPFPEDRTLAAMEDWMCLVYNLKEQQLFLGDFIGCYVNTHNDRSMNQNQAVIQKRLKATQILVQEINFTSADRKTLWAYSYYFCAVHAYLDFNRKQALGYIRKSLTTGGIKKEFIIAAIKILVGKKIINKIANKTK